MIEMLCWLSDVVDVMGLYVVIEHLFDEWRRYSGGSGG